MILYNKTGMFLGMGNQELNLLGYEDMEEFRNYHNDIAELFMNKPGFIFKFKNFSWIDYTLHSGTPNRRVLLKTKNGREIEASLLIHEIFLEKELYDAKSCFGVELLTGTVKSESFVATSVNSKAVEEVSLPEPSSFIMEDAPSFSTHASEAPIDFNEDFSTFSPSSKSLDEAPEDTLPEPIEEEYKPSEITFPTSKTDDEERATPFKLKFDTTILDVPVKIEIKEEPDTHVFENSPLKEALEDEAALEVYPEDGHEDLLRDPNLMIEAMPSLIETEVQNASSFDFEASAETLGLDLSTLAEVIEEYCTELESQMEQIEQQITQGETQKASEEILKLASVASHLGISSLYQQLIELEQSLEISSAESIEELFEQTQKTIMEFKDLVQ